MLDYSYQFCYNRRRYILWVEDKTADQYMRCKVAEFYYEKDAKEYINWKNLEQGTSYAAE